MSAWPISWPALACRLARTLTGSVEVLSLGVFMVLYGLGLPRLSRTAVKLVES